MILVELGQSRVALEELLMAADSLQYVLETSIEILPHTPEHPPPGARLKYPECTSVELQDIFVKERQCLSHAGLADEKLSVCQDQWKGLSKLLVGLYESIKFIHIIACGLRAISNRISASGRILGKADNRLVRCGLGRADQQPQLHTHTV